MESDLSDRLAPRSSVGLRSTRRTAGRSRVRTLRSVQSYFFLQCAALEHKYLHCQELGLVDCRVTLFHLTLDEDTVLSNNPERSHLTFDEDKEVSNAELGHCKVEIVINMVCGRINLAGGHFDCALWELMDSSLPAPDRRQKKLVTRWIKWLTENQDSERKKAVLQMTLKILCEVHTCDPRKTLQYRGKMWCKEGRYKVLAHAPDAQLCFAHQKNSMYVDWSVDQMMEAS
ncbi:uncharacterized protein LOC129583337 [Paramacrobiotus metropolitanus]|uniref:uncharacterized protein LOC129583337 n=1 Tax=Paramacrobiotus metropolitanus TaxID=2943436 RepID=UPI0024462A27|nr:uncharacterized protein LOC129583337 [Paramacrobiotus metropolitanus]